MEPGEKRELLVTAEDDWPTELRVTDGGRVLAMSFESGTRFDLTAEYLRVTSPSAEVQGHSEAERQTVGGKRRVRIASVTPVGNYAVKLGFDDGHDTGLFSWRYLRELGAEHDARWAAYLKALETKGLSRGGED
jgi:DUF971 family protein